VRRDTKRPFEERVTEVLDNIVRNIESLKRVIEDIEGPDSCRKPEGVGEFGLLTIKGATGNAMDQLVRCRSSLGRAKLMRSIILGEAKRCEHIVKQCPDDQREALAKLRDRIVSGA
jgi:hypothetical protein